MKKFMNDRPNTEGKRLKTKVQRSWIIVLCSLFSILCSCSTNKETTNLRMMSANHIIREVEDNRFEFDNLEATIAIKMKDDNLPSLKGQIRMQNDSVIWISLSLKVGIEVARIMITDDSIKFINRNTRTYIYEDIEFIDNVFPVDASLDFIQNILVGNIDNLKRDEKYKVTIVDNQYKLETNKAEIISNDIWVLPEKFKVSKYNIQENFNNNEIEIQYGEFRDINGKLMPSKISFNLTSKHHIYIDIQYSDIRTGKKLNFPFNISKKYEKTYLW